ncbi:ankyrin repeat domain-containing protein [Aspergillus novofumigatus IBT 16806]|uniref:Ankyrin n=1 Tax=Aspergillus novofumigatus (strain IBT 16806) TaxID=1392255 RepID=A0A2I1BXQ7_ASPN1|nr:ankyrin [Aspergillus novofumigatus IBT 16806]PKX90164.1 ankyrin [Aspergillus novofumigatus IBT 16806]
MGGTELNLDQSFMLLGRVMWNVWPFLSKKALMFIRPHLGVKLLVEHGVDIDMVRVRGTTPVKMAVEYGHFDIASYLLGQGAKVPEDQDFFVSCATRGYAKGLSLLLDKAVSIDGEDSEGYTAIFNAVAHGHVEAVSVLLDRGFCYTYSRRTWPPSSFGNASGLR